MNYISKKRIRKSDRGLTFSFDAKGTKFDIGNHYMIDVRNRQIVILPSNNQKSRVVSKKKAGSKQKSLFDIRNREVLEAFSNCDYLEVIIYKEQIRVIGHHSIVELEVKNKQAEVVFDKQELLQASGSEGYAINTCIANSSYLSSSEKDKAFKVHENTHIPLKIMSLFSGAGMFDYAFKKEGFDIVFALEINKDACETYSYNIGPIENADIRNYDSKIKKGVDILVGSPSCKPCTRSRCNYNQVKPDEHEDSDLIDEYIKWVKDQDVKIFVMENVPGLLTYNDGYYLKKIENELAEYDITYGVLNDVEMGGFQNRRRAICFGTKLGQKIPLPKPIVLNKENFKTVFDAINHITRDMPNSDDYTRSSEVVIERMKHVPPGGNIKDIPFWLQTKAKHSNAYRRLDYNKPCITLTNFRKPIVIHPKKSRIITVREAAALSGLPDDYTFFGSLDAKQTQVGNGVPVALGRSIAKKIKAFVNNFNHGIRVLPV